MTDAADGSVSISIGNERSFLSALVGATDRIGLLPEALSGLGSNVRVHVGEDVEVGANEVSCGPGCKPDSD